MAVFDPYTFCTNINRLAAKNPQGEELLAELLSEDTEAMAPIAVAVGVAEGDPIGRVLRDILHSTQNAEVSMRLLVLIPHQTVALRELAAEVTEQAIKAFGRTQLPVSAAMLNDLSNRFSELGRPDQALACAEQAVANLRELGAKQPSALSQNLCISLITLARRLNELGRQEEALLCAQDALRVFPLLPGELGQLAQSLANSLHNFSKILADMGRLDEALPMLQEAVSIYRGLIEHRDELRASLALALRDLSAISSKLGRRVDALALAQEALGIHRELGPADTFQPDLGLSLNNAACCLSALGSMEEALPMAEEAVAVYRNLASRREVFRPVLAGCLHNLANRLGEAGRLEEALTVAREVVGIYEQLTGKTPDSIRADRALSLHTLAAMLSELGHWEEALAPALDAVKFRREIAHLQPSSLALSLDNLAIILRKLGRWEEGLAHCKEALEILGPLALRYPNAFHSHLEIAQRNLSSLLEQARGDKQPPTCYHPWLGNRYGPLLALENQCRSNLTEQEVEYLVRLRNSSKTSNQEAQNAMGVCLLRSDRPEEAVELFRELVLIADSTSVRNDVPIHFITNYATALLLCRNIAGCERVLNELERINELNGPAFRLRDAIVAAQRSLRFFDRMKSAIGAFPKPITLNFPAGDFLSEQSKPLQ